MSWHRLLREHDALLATVAMPRRAAARRRAERGLHAIAGRLAEYARRHGGRTPATLDQSGIAGTTTTATFSLDLARWLAQRHPREVTLEWQGGSLGEVADDLLASLVEPAEWDGFRAPGHDVRGWLKVAAGGISPLAWLFERIHHAGRSSPLTDRAFDSLELGINWRLGRASRTFTRFPPRPTFWQREPPRRRVDLQALLKERLPAPRRLDRAGAERLIAVARDTLAARGRETDPVTYGTQADVTLYHLERGIDVALFGLAPSRRLPLDTYVGFVAARNRVPVAYGGGWAFFGRCDIGVNLFEEFRGGESAVVFGQVLRTYRQRFRVAQFLVEPFQFGADNPEAIRSGAFWFYHRLGFRPTEPALRALASREAARVNERPGHRSSPRTLRRLAGGPLFLDVGAAEPPAHWTPVAPDIAELGLAVTRWIGRRFSGDRERAHRWAVRRVARALGVRSTRRWPERERLWFERLALLVAMIPDLGRWPRSDRVALRLALRAKGAARERRFVLLTQALPRLREALEQF